MLRLDAVVRWLRSMTPDELSATMLYLTCLFPSHGAQSDANEAQIAAHEAQSEAQNEAQTGTQRAPSEAQTGTQRAPNEAQNEAQREYPERSSVSEFSPAFLRFWSAYPRRVGKQQAYRIWLKLKPDSVLLDRILLAVGRSKTSAAWTKDQGQFIPYPATWLHQGRWDDEIDVVVGSSPRLDVVPNHGMYRVIP